MLKAATLSLLLLGACSSDPAQPTGPDARVQAAADAHLQSPDAHVADAAPVSPQTLGSSCTCETIDCNQLGVPKPTQGTIMGCDNVPADWTGGARACLRSYSGSLATATYFANGYCSIMAASCEGASLICDSAGAGDYALMVACPAGSVLITDTQQVSVLSQNATIHTKLCAPTCASAADCRPGENDTVAGGPSQEQCVDKGGVKFCYDPRNLSSGYSVTAF